MTQLAVVERAKQALASTKTEKALAVLAGEFKDFVVVKDKTDHTLAMSALGKLRGARVAIQKTAKDARQDATDFQKAGIEEERRLIGIIAPEEDRIQGIRKDWEAAEEEKRRELARKEKERVEAIKERMAKFTSIVLDASGQGSGQLAAAIAAVTAVVPDKATFAEFVDEATRQRDAALERLNALHADAIALELRECERREQEAAERERLARIEAEQKAREAELRKAAEEQRQREEESRLQVEAERRRAAEQLAAQEDDLRRKEAEIARREQAIKDAEEAERRKVEEELRPVEPVDAPDPEPAPVADADNDQPEQEDRMRTLDDWSADYRVTRKALKALVEILEGWGVQL